ncbi:hypothetical protein D1872_292560 [compost metagenome]
MKDPDFGSAGFSFGEPVAALEGSPVVVDGGLSGSGGFIVRLLDGQHMVVDHGPGDKRPGQFGGHADGQHDESQNKCIFRRQGVFEQ